jgi:hypothetical protein
VSSLTALAREDCRINAPSVVPHAEPELSIIISDFNLNLPSLGVPKCVAQRLGGNPVDLVTQDGMQISRLAFNRYTECRPIASRVGCEFFSERAYG